MGTKIAGLIKGILAEDKSGDFDKALAKYVAIAEKGVQRFLGKKWFVDWMKGNKFYRVYKIDSAGDKSVYSFVDSETGNVYGAASWKKRKKRIEGNIFN